MNSPRLTRRQTITAAAFAFDGMSRAEMASEFGVSSQAIKKRLSRARKALGRYAAALSRGGAHKAKFRPISLSFVTV